MVTAVQGASIAQRLDRLPLTWTLWRRSVGTGWTDGFGHVGSMVWPLILGSLFTATASLGYIGIFAYVIIPGALLPALLLARFGIKQKAAPLETVAAA